MTARPEPSYEGDFTFATDAPFLLDGGGSLQPVTLRYALYGKQEADNVVLVCHALSGSARVGDWWHELFGPGLPFDTSRWCILGINVLGSCYGSTGPRSLNPGTGRPYGGDFPVVSIADIVRAQAVVADHLGIERFHAVLGGSIGGMQALAWAIQFPLRVARCAVIGAAPLGAMGLALTHLQVQAILSDPAWRGGHYHPDEPPRTGLALARALATCSYKSAALFEQRFGRKPNRSGESPHRCLADRFDVGGYLDYQGRSFLERFDAASYLLVTRAMETFELGRTPEEETGALGRIRARMLLVGIGCDWLFPPEDVRRLCERMRSLGVLAEYAEIPTTHGHDGFLADTALVAPLLLRVLES
jgi:homoserine O-acetyltransferase